MTKNTNKTTVSFWSCEFNVDRAAKLFMDIVCGFVVMSLLGRRTSQYGN